VHVKQVWQGRMLQAAARYGEAAPVTACCNACRTCATTNLATLALGALAAASARCAHLAERLVKLPRSGAGKAGTDAL
jgi:hypothetical protein